MAKRRPKKSDDPVARAAEVLHGSSAAGGRSQRQHRVGENLRRALSDILLRGDAHDPELARHSITVSEVRTSPDLRHATVYVLPLGGRDADAALAALVRARGQLRTLLGRAVVLKYAPELHFELDVSFDRMDETRRLLAEERVVRDVRSAGPLAAPGDDGTD